MLASYVAAGAIGVGPSVARRRRTLGNEVARAHVPRPLELAWASVQGMIALVTVLCATIPGALISLDLPAFSTAQPSALWAGALVFVVGAGLTGWAARALGRQLTATIEVRTGDELITAGPYAAVRHPVYTGIFTMTAGLLVALPGAVSASAFIVALAVGRYRALAEENLLLRDDTHGAAYAEYMQRTGRFVPTLR